MSRGFYVRRVTTNPGMKRHLADLGHSRRRTIYTEPVGHALWSRSFPGTNPPPPFRAGTLSAGCGTAETLVTFEAVGREPRARTILCRFGGDC